VTLPLRFTLLVRTLDPDVDDAIAAAALALLIERGFARMTIEAVAKAAGVGKPAIYRRFNDKAGLVAHVISRQLPALELPDLGDSRAELWRAVEQGLPVDGPAYVGLIGGLISEQDRHPELIEAFRERILLPRRGIVRAIIERGQARGQIRVDLDPEMALELMAGPFLARVFAGLDTGPRWREAAFDTWWEVLRERQVK
jgi:AcrR family transcriptional regulator